MARMMKQTFKMTALAAAVFGAYGSALAGQGLVLEPNSVSVGVGVWSEDRFQRGVFDGMRESGTYGLIDANVLQRYDDTGTTLGLKARNLGLDNRELKAEWLRQGNIGASLEYSRIVRDAPYIVNTGLLGIDSTLQTVVNITPGTGSNVELGTQRDRVTASFFKNLGPALKFNVSYRNEDKEGRRHYGRGGAPEFAVEPIDSTIRLLDAVLSYSRGALQLSGGYYGSQYTTNNKLITSIGTATYYLTQPLDNQGHEVYLNGGYSFTPATRGTFKLSYSRATQDDHLPTADIPGLANAAAPTHLDGRIDTTMAELGLTARPLPRLSILANLRYRDFDDKTPVQQYVFTGTLTWNTPWSYTNKIGKLEGTYRLGLGYSVLGGIEYNSQDRSFPTLGTIRVPFVKQLDTATYRLQLRKAMSETVNGSLAYVREDRDGKDFVASGQAQENLVHPMHIADRTRDKVRAMLDWSPLARLSVQFAVEGAQDKYGDGPGNSPLGLQEGTGSIVSADISYRLTSGLELFAWASRDESKAEEITIEQAGASERKFNTLKETGTSFGAGVKGKPTNRMKVGGDVQQFRSVNKYDQTLVGVTLNPAQVPVPDITNKLLKFTLFTEYALQKNADVRLDLIHERWSTDDWSWTYFPASGPAPWPYGAATDGTTVLVDPKQNSTFAGIRYKIKF